MSSVEKINITEKVCNHGKCFGHEPDWEKTHELEFIPRPSSFLQRKTSLSDSCCGKRMLRVRVRVKAKCRECDRIDAIIKSWEDENSVFCECCRRYYSTVNGYSYPVEW